MIGPLTERADILRQKSIDAAHDLPQKAQAEFIRQYHSQMIREARESIRFLERDIVFLVRMRDSNLGDMEVQELLWFNIRDTQECIKQEYENLASHREGINLCRTTE